MIFRIPLGLRTVVHFEPYELVCVHTFVILLLLCVVPVLHVQTADARAWANAI